MPRREELPERVLKRKLTDALVSAKDELRDLVEGQLASRRTLEERGEPLTELPLKEQLALLRFQRDRLRKLARVRGEERE